MTKSRYVFDTNATISALLIESSTPAQAFYTALQRGELLVSSATFLELRDVLGRPKFDRYVTKQEREQFLVKLLLQARLVETDLQVRARRDPKDDKFLELALCGTVTRLITGDPDLLVLNPFRGIQIVTPRQFLDTLD